MLRLEDSGSPVSAAASNGGTRREQQHLLRQQRRRGHRLQRYGGTTRYETRNSPTGGNCGGTITDGGGNLSYGDATCPGIHGDPKLGPLQANGGPTQTMTLGAGSAARDAGDDAICAAAPVNDLDQRGVARPRAPTVTSGV